MNFNELTEFISRRWPRLVMEQMLITYKIPKYESCLLSNDADLHKMIQVVRNMRLPKVDLNVGATKRINDRMDDRRLNDGIRSNNMQIVEIIEMEPNLTGKKKCITKLDVDTPFFPSHKKYKK